MYTLKIGVIGSGQVAMVLANGFLKYGHSVMMGSRDMSKLTEWKNKSGGKGQIGSFADAAKFGEVVVIAVKGNAALKAVEEAGAGNLKGKTVIDVNNPIAEEAPVNGVLKFFTGPNESLMEKIQSLLPDAYVVKAFSCVGNSHMINPQFPGGPPTMFICGNSENAKQTVKDILTQFGWETADMGKAEAARAIEPLCMLWCIPGFSNNSWGHAFKLLKQ